MDSLILLGERLSGGLKLVKMLGGWKGLVVVVILGITIRSCLAILLRQLGVLLVSQSTLVELGQKILKIGGLRV